MGDQLSLMDALVGPRLGTYATPERIDGPIDWSCLATVLGGLRSGETAEARARCHSLERNAADVFAFVAVYNLRKAVITAG